MVEHDRRDVLKYTGLTAMGGLLSTGVAAADEARSTPLEESPGWSSLGGNPGNNPVVPAGSDPEPPVTVAWEYDHGGPVAVVDDTVYLTADGEVHALDAADGTLEWKTENIGATGTPAVTADLVYVGGERLTQLKRDDGEICCQSDLGYDEAIPSPVIANDRVFVVADGVLYAVDAHDNDERWQFEPDGDPLYEQPVAVGGGAVFAVSESRAFALELEDGTVRWADEEPVGDDEHSRFMEPNPRQTSSPVATDDVVAIGSADTDENSMWPLGYTTLYDVETGEQRASSERNPFDPGPITDGRFYGLDSHKGTGYDRETGEEVWNAEVNTYRVPSMAVGDGIVYAGLTIDGMGYDPDDVPEEIDGVYALDAETGEIEWSVGTNEIPSIAIADETIYASSETLVAIRSEGDDRPDGSDEEDQTDDGDDADGSDDTDDSGEDAPAEDENSDGGDDTNESTTGDTDEPDVDDADDGNASDDESGTDNGAEDTEEAVPGFTTGAGVVSGAAALEWLRRRNGSADDAAK
ncbi:outer membrane protein assembly factor BamB family protein [Natronorubrum texcoconense]|uniref:Outer membrane protein assembly factor BamB, contains PQQ-like beta-propeller repeat n=1 Tax=Natronorubrum texcoconense TaxID=1095776 RepID=A0A1G9BDT7_9EURY|nr:PQQ-binding-like beta-propeller repeat protein [Natronorubrum texcoconense]SDK37649.1 Outer membrane protein assembly factor BamB, contains PQQ-like beta-propeller repeat [Natronorubrum texcoconense]